MQVFCDGSYSPNGNAAIGMVLINGNYIVGRDGYLVEAASSSEAEIKALQSALLWAISLEARYVYTDDKPLSERWQQMAELEGYAGIFTGSVRWIPREKNSLANGIAKMTAKGNDWKDIIARSALAKVTPTDIPLVWNSGGHVVTVHNHRFYCNCKQYAYLKQNSFHCEHIMAVMRELNFINGAGEGIF